MQLLELNIIFGSAMEFLGQEDCMHDLRSIAARAPSRPLPCSVSRAKSWGAGKRRRLSRRRLVQRPTSSQDATLVAAGELIMKLYVQQSEANELIAKYLISQLHITSYVPQ